MAKQQNNNDWLKILVAAAEIGYFINRLNNNKVDAEYANNLMLRLGLYGLLGNNLYNGMSARQLSASRNSTALTDVEVQKRLTAKQKKYFITLADNKSKVEDLLTNEDNKVEADEFKNIVNDVFTKPKFEIAKEQKQKLDSISKQLEKRYSSKPLKFKLDEIYINDYRILKDFRIKFDSNISIIIGENGSGKSTLIEYISNAFARMFLDSMRKEINWTEYDLGKFEFKYSFYNDEENVKVAVKNESDVFLPIYTSESSTLWPDRFVVSYSGITDRLKKMVKENFEDTFVRIINNDGSKYSISPTEFNLPKNRFYYADDRYLNLIYCSLLFSKHEEAKALLDKIGVDFSRCEITFQFGETYHKYKNNFKGNIAPRFFDTLSVLSVGSILVGNQLQDMFREFRTDISSQEVFDILYYLKLNDLINDIKISWKNESGSFDLEHISEGQKQELMTLGLSLVFDSPNTLFLLDEPDTYLHPKWQREFISSLTKALEKGGCAIVTTHSPSVVSDVKKEQLTILRHGKIVETSFNNYGKEVGEILIDYFGLDSTRSKDVQARIDDLRNMIANDEYETETFKQKFDELSDLIGSDNKELPSIKRDIKRREYAKNQ